MRLLPVLLILLATAATAVAAKRDVREVTLERDGRYSIDRYVMGGAELTGYLGELQETEGLEAVVLKGRHTPEQEEKFAAAAKKAGVKAYVEEDGAQREAGSAAAGDQP